MFITRALRATAGGYMEAVGDGRAANNKAMQGMTVASMKHHYALTPLFVIMTAGVTMVVGMCIRAAMRQTDVNWSKNKEPDYAMNHYRNKQYCFLNPNGKDLSKPSPIPDYRN